MGKARDFVEKMGALSVGFSFVIAVFMGLAFGYYLDGKFDTFPIMSVIGLVVGFAAGLRNIYLELKKV